MYNVVQAIFDALLCVFVSLFRIFVHGQGKHRTITEKHYKTTLYIAMRASLSRSVLFCINIVNIGSCWVFLVVMVAVAPAAVAKVPPDW